MALLEDGYRLLPFSKDAAHMNKVKLDTLKTTKLQTEREFFLKRLFADRDDGQLLRVSLNSWRMTSCELQKEWDIAAEAQVWFKIAIKSCKG